MLARRFNDWAAVILAFMVLPVVGFIVKRLDNAIVTN